MDSQGTTALAAALERLQLWLDRHPADDRGRIPPFLGPDVPRLPDLRDVMDEIRSALLLPGTLSEPQRIEGLSAVIAFMVTWTPMVTNDGEPVMTFKQKDLRTLASTLRALTGS